jgi:hypothetical protein
MINRWGAFFFVNEKLIFHIRQFVYATSDSTAYQPDCAVLHEIN